MALVQVALSALALLYGFKVVKAKNQNYHILLMAISVVLIFPFFGCGDS